MVKNSKNLFCFLLGGFLLFFQIAKPAAQQEQKEAAARPNLAEILSGLSSERGPWEHLSNIIQRYEPVSWQSFQGKSKVLVEGAIRTFASSTDGRYLAYVFNDNDRREDVIYDGICRISIKNQ